MKNQSRREFIQGSGSAFGRTWLGLNLPIALAIAQTACARRDTQAGWQNLTEAEVAGFSALVDQIIPPDESPGAAEIGVVYFLDEALNDHLAGNSKSLKKGMAQLDTAVQILEAAGATEIWRNHVGPGNVQAHLLGTCRMGDDPDSSVVDRFHRSHEVPNLFICDGSSLVSSGRDQPTMTIQALAFRAAEHIAMFARRGEI
jgi:choline dehydrogenase-like flavoprotein